MPTTTTFGTLIRRLREKKELSQRDLAAALDIRQARISQLEKNSASPSLQEFLKYKFYFKVDANKFLIHMENPL